MAKGNHTKIANGGITYSFWLVFGKGGAVRVTRLAPVLDRDERGMHMSATLPVSLFTAPQLSAKITVVNPASEAPAVDLKVAAEALEAALGVNVDLRLQPASLPGPQP